ncbi:hypothetical protein ACL02S_16110 [Nocardia sp. 004]|uniref:hypothetical protein n=1 Tax=Nocardia sp. 004 TaxID=3385978 RepID=UPI0039A2D978
MTTPMSRPNGPGTSTGTRESHSGIPLPGQHLSGVQGHPEPADPDRIRSEVAALLAEMDSLQSGAVSAESGVDITRRARVLEQAHEVLVQALATVDKI